MLVLLDAGAGWGVKDGVGLDALHHAAFFGRTSTITILLVHGAELEKQEDDSFLALHLTAPKDRLGTVMVLLKAGADVNSPT